MSFEHLELETEGKGEKITQDQAAAKAAELSDIGTQIKQIAEARDPEVANALRNDPDLRAEILTFIQLAANNQQGEHTGEFNAESFDKDGETGLDKFEFDQFANSLDAAIDQIIILDGLDAFNEVHEESGEDSWYEVDKHLANGANALTDGVLDAVIGDDKDGSLAEKILNSLDISDEEIQAMRDRPFSISSAESWQELSTLLALELGEGVEDIIRFLINIPAAVILVPRYLYLRTQLNSSDPQTAAEAEIKLAELTGENPALGILDLLGEKGVEAIKQIGAMMTSGKQGDIATATVSAAGLIAGGAGALKIGARMAKAKKLEAAAGRVQRGAEKVDDIVGGAGLGHITGGFNNTPIAANDNIPGAAAITGGAASYINRDFDRRAANDNRPDGINEVHGNSGDPRVGDMAQIKRSDGRTHEAKIIAVDEKGNVTFEWQEGGGTASKTVSPDDFLKANPRPSLPKGFEPPQIGNTSLIKRSDGRVHEAKVTAVDEKGNVTFEWQEGGGTANKTVSAEEFLQANPRGQIKPPTIGEIGAIRRSDGRVHPAQVKKITADGRVTLEWQEPNGDVASKTISREEFDELNRKTAPEPVQPRNANRVPENISNFDDLITWIKQQPEGIQGSNGLIKQKEILEMIDDVRTGQLPISTITRSGGLRAKVEALVRKEKSPERLNRERLIKRLWPNGIDSHLKQGHVGNCYFIAALRGVKAHRKAQKILTHMIEEKPDGSVVVRFPGDKAQREIPISRRDLDEMEAKGLTGSLGDRILERAYARLVREQKENVIDGKRSGRTVLVNIGEQMAFEGGHAYRSFKEMFGDFFQEKVIENKDIVSALKQITPSNKDNFIISLSSKPKQVSSGRADSYKYGARDVNGRPIDLYHGHAYGVEDVDIANKRVLVVNPHNTEQQRFWMTFQQVQDHFGVIKGGILDNNRMLDAIENSTSNSDHLFNQAGPDAWMYQRAA